MSMESTHPRIIASLNALTTTLLPSYDTIPSLKSSTLEVSKPFNNQHQDALKRYWGVNLTISSAKTNITSPQSNNTKNTTTNDPSVFVSILLTTLNTKLNTPTRLKLTLFLYILSTPIGCFCLFGNVYNLLQWKAFPRWTLAERIDALQGLKDSVFVFKRAAFIGLKQFICGIAFSHVATDDNIHVTGGGMDSSEKKVHPMKMNPFWEAMGVSVLELLHFTLRLRLFAYLIIIILITTPFPSLQSK